MTQLAEAGIGELRAALEGAVIAPDEDGYDDATAFSGARTDRYAVFVVAQCPVPELQAAEQAWVREFWDALQPHAAGIGSYVNGMADATEDRIRASYGGKYDRLAQIKAKYDPDNVFHRNQNITPA